MERNIYQKIDPYRCPSPSFVVDADDLETNLKILDSVQKRTGCKILLAQKGFAMYYFYPLIRQYLAGVCASGLYEAKLGREEFGKEVHTYSPAFKTDEFDEVARISDCLVFNSFSQLKQFLPVVKKYNKEIGIRVNPRHSETETAIYDPCRPGSRLGVTIQNFEEDQLDNIHGIHFHTLCEKNADSLERTLAAAEKQFGKFFNRLKWVNFGGGHHITRDDYDIELLCRIIADFRKHYNNVDVYLEPGEAIALNAGVFVSTVVDIAHNEDCIAILDSSASTHMPDVLEMPYRPMIIGSGLPNEKKHTYTIGGCSCLAGDIIGAYSFDKELKPGDRLVFTDMAHYTMVKTTTFNGAPLPSIVAARTKNGEYKVIREFGYNDYKERLS